MSGQCDTITSRIATGDLLHRKLPRMASKSIIPAEDVNALIPSAGFGSEFGQQQTFQELLSTGESYTIPGYTLIEDKLELLGVPHLITGVTYQKPKADQRGFVSVQGVVADQDTLADAVQRGRIPNKLTVHPGEYIVYNDGSTGIRRQLTMQFQMLGMLNVGLPDSDGDARFDIPWTEWADFSQSIKQGDAVDAPVVPCFTKNHVGRQLVIQAMRGLRASEYSNQYADDAVTFYLS